VIEAPTMKRLTGIVNFIVSANCSA